MDIAILTYVFILVLAAIVVLFVWGIWCTGVLKILNLIIVGLGGTKISTQMCHRSLSLLEQSKKPITPVTPVASPQPGGFNYPTINIPHVHVSPEIIIPLLLIFGLVLSVYLLGRATSSLPKRDKDFVKKNWEWLKYLLAGAAAGVSRTVSSEIVKMIERLFGKKPRDKPICTILFLTADPTNLRHLRLQKEFREIQSELQSSKHRKKFILKPIMAVRPPDISQSLLDTHPTIVHFSGHGAFEGSLCFENEEGEAHLISPDALAALFKRFANQIKCVVLNACYSEIQANAIARYIEFVIGMSQQIDDEAAIAFSIGFYQAVGAGCKFEEAYELGCVQIQLHNIPEHLTPVLIKGKSHHQ
jgi:hypothetical protein